MANLYMHGGSEKFLGRWIVPVSFVLGRELGFSQVTRNASHDDLAIPPSIAKVKREAVVFYILVSLNISL